MRTFSKFPEGKRCPICGTSEDAECTLVPIVGTEEGNNCEATVVHVECIGEALVYDRNRGVFFASGGNE